MVGTHKEPAGGGGRSFQQRVEAVKSISNFSKLLLSMTTVAVTLKFVLYTHHAVFPIHAPRLARALTYSTNIG